MPDLDVCPVEELPPGARKIVTAGLLSIGVFNCDGELLAIEDRCSHDDGPLAEGDFESDDCILVCPRHGARFDMRSGRPLSLPAYEPVDTFAVHVVDGIVRVHVP